MSDLENQDFNFTVTYSMVEGKPKVTGTSIFPAPVDGDKSAVDAEGNVTLGKKDSAFVNFNCATEGCAISALQIEGKKGWGQPLGKKAQKNFPDADKDTGMVPAGPDGNFALRDVNKKSNSIEYRVQLTQADGTAIWADPRVRSIGR